MRVMAAKDGVQGRRRLRIFAAAAALVLLCAVCVGGVSGAVFEVSTEQGLKNAVGEANVNGEDDIIIIMNNILYDDKASLEVLSGKLTIVNAAGADVTISRTDSWRKTTFPSIFYVSGGELVLSVSDEGGSLTLDGNNNILSSPGGGAVFVDSGTLIMNDGVTLKDFGYLGSSLFGSGRGAVYVNNPGTFIMNGGTISGSRADIGGGVYVAANEESGGEFYMNGGLITGNGHGDYPFSGSTYGGGVYIQDGGYFSQSGDAEVTGNTGDPKDIVYNNPDTTIHYTVMHYFQKTDGTYALNSALTETVEGEWGTAAKPKYTNAHPLSVPGYESQPIEQQPLYEGGDTVVSVYYDIVIYYKIEIPASLNLADDVDTGEFTMTPIELRILDQGKVVVSVYSQNSFQLVHKEVNTARISYDLKSAGTVIEQNKPVAEFTLANQTPVLLTLELTGQAACTGVYDDILTFTAQYIENTLTEG